MRELIIEAPAKVNLTLDILGKRKDGYHNLESLMQAVDLKDKIYLQKEKSEGFAVSTSSDSIPEGGDNIAYSSARLMFQRFNLDGGLSIHIEKNIPTEGGLGGGSSDAAAVIRGIIRMYSLSLGLSELLPLAAAVGSDVPFFLRGGTALISGRGEKVWEVPDLPQLELSLIVFPEGLPTKEVYQNFNLTKKRYRTRKALAGVYDLNWEEVKKHAGNDLENAACTLKPEIREVFNILRENNCYKFHLSGSGPTVVVYSHLSQKIQDRLERLSLKIIGVRTLRKDFND